MVTGDLKNKIDLLWNAFFAGGLSNPLDVVEQVTYLMFLHDLGDFDARQSKRYEEANTVTKA